MAAHRYWRLNITGNGSDVYSIVEWQLFNTIGGSNAMFPSATGANVIVDGDFATAPGPWFTGTGVTIGSGVATASNATGLLAQTGILTIGQTYRIQFDYTMTAGSKIRISNNATANGSNIKVFSPVLGSSGTMVLYFTASTADLAIEADTANFSGTIDNVSVAPAPLQPTITASNNLGSPYLISNINDGVVTGDNCWAAAVGNGSIVTIVADFGASNTQDIVEFALVPRNGWPFQCPIQGSLQWSDDNITYTDLFPFSTSQFNSGNETKYFTGEAVPTTQLANNTSYGRAPNLSVPREPLRNYVISQLGAGSCAVLRVHTGRHYSEYVITTLTGTPAVGIIGSSFNTNSATLIGADNNALSYRSNGTVVLNAVTLATLATFAQGDRVDMAVDPLNFLIWFRVNGGNWNNNVANDPVAGVGGIDYSSMAGKGRILAGVGFSVSGARIDGHFSAASFVGTPPTGYGSYDTIEYTVGRPSGPLVIAANIPPAVAQTIESQARCAIMPGANNRMFSPAGAITVVSGVVQESGSPVAGRRVDVYDRNTSERIGTAYSAGDGSWSIPCLGRPTVRVVCSDPTTYNCLVYDAVVPA